MDAADIETAEPPGARAVHREQSEAPGGVAACVDIIDRTGALPSATRRWLTERSRAAVAHLGVGGDVRVAVVRDNEMARAHERFSNVAGTTDVLTFDLRSSAGDAALDVDILVCADEAQRQAAARAVPLEHELLLYIVHGVLHCLGEDDHDPDAAGRMHEREDRILAAIGVGAVYSAQPKGATP